MVIASVHEMKPLEAMRVIDARYNELVAGIIDWIRSLPDTMRQSGDDSPYDDVWLEYAAQVQGEHGVTWHLAEDLIADHCSRVVADLAAFEVTMLWLASESYWDWVEGPMPHSDSMRDNVARELRDRLGAAAANLQLPE